MNMLSALSPTQLFELMSQMKLLIQQNPEHARQLLYQNPQLAYAILHAQLMMGMVDSSLVQVSWMNLRE
jgi:cleavage stimulation factor subunit 2